MPKTWKDGSCIRCETDFFEEENPDEDVHYAWFKIKPNLYDTEEEKKEIIAARNEQIKNGIITPEGNPVGLEPPKIKENSWQRKKRREMERKFKKMSKKNRSGRF